MKTVEKRVVKQAGIGLIALSLVALGYMQIFTKGVDRLPEKVCSGAVDRKIAADVLPSTMTAHERGKRGTSYAASRGTVFYCYVKTRSGDSILSGEVHVNDVSADSWRRKYAGHSTDTRGARAGDVAALTTSEGVSLYVPCTRPNQKNHRPLQAYAMTAEARTIGDTKATGDELQQHLADFAYQMLRHTYKVEECQEARTLAAEMPRLE